MTKIKKKREQKREKKKILKKVLTKKQRPRKEKKDDIDTAHDVFYVDEEPENINELKKYEDVDVYEYQLPANYEDEEISEDEAFNAEDEEIYGSMKPIQTFNKRKGKKAGICWVNRFITPN
jgi:hypothetical protein